MTMELTLGRRYSLVLQVVAIVAFYQRKVSSERVQGCVGSSLSLRCPEMKVIQITAVVLGDTYCNGVSCCIKDNDCTRNANANHRTDVHSRCDNKQSCTVGVLKEKIPCGYRGAWSNNDFERIIYICIDNPQIVTMNSTAEQESTEDDHGPDPDSSNEEPTMDQDYSHSLTSTDGTRMEADDQRDTGPATPASNSATSGIVITCVICLIVIIAIVASVSVVIVRRKKKRQVKSSDTVKMSDIRTGRKEAIYMSEAQGTNLNENDGLSVPIYSNDDSKENDTCLKSGAKNLETPTSDYCELEGVARRRIQCDSEYEQLDHGRNYEPLIVYEQLQ